MYVSWFRLADIYDTPLSLVYASALWRRRGYGSDSMSPLSKEGVALQFTIKPQGGYCRVWMERLILGVELIEIEQQMSKC